MRETSLWRRVWGWLMSIGSYPGEPEGHAGRRRIVVGYMVFGIPPRLVAALGGFASGQVWIGIIDMLAWILPALGLVALSVRPRWYVGIVNALLASLLLENLVPTVLLGGILEAGLLMAWTPLAVIGALIALDRRSGLFWLIASVGALILSSILPDLIDPLYDVAPPPASEFVASLVGTVVFSYLGMAYFVRQRDRFQQQSDDLLHNILPEEVAARLKTERALIADDYEAVSVMFADVVDFTPMSSSLTPSELVGLLNSVFTRLDSFVEELGLEKIKTVGDEYMVASGVPHVRSDHAHAIADLALRIRDYCASNQFDGRSITMRIGLNSGPVIAGIVGTHKFAYDLWGDVVNVASRMESEGVAGGIQLGPSTYELIRDEFVCEMRGRIPVKGKGEMETYFLIGRRE